jgi:hypothetical protein
MTPRKAARAAAPDGANGPRRLDLLGRQDRAEATSAKPSLSSAAPLAVYDQTADAGPSKNLLKALEANLGQATEYALRERLAAAIKRLRGARS